MGLSDNFAQSAPSSARTIESEPYQSRLIRCSYSIVYEKRNHSSLCGSGYLPAAPGTAGGVVFMTMEDETGFVNVVVWASVFQHYSVLAKTVSFLGIAGKLQVEDGVVHLVAEKLWESKLELKPTAAPSR